MQRAGRKTGPFCFADVGLDVGLREPQHADPRKDDPGAKRNVNPALVLKPSAAWKGTAGRVVRQSSRRMPAAPGCASTRSISDRPIPCRVRRASVTKWRMWPVARPYPSSGMPGAPCVQPPAPRMSPCGSRASQQLPQASSSGLAREFREIATTRTKAG